MPLTKESLKRFGSTGERRSKWQRLVQETAGDERQMHVSESTEWRRNGNVILGQPDWRALPLRPTNKFRRQPAHGINTAR